MRAPAGPETARAIWGGPLEGGLAPAMEIVNRSLDVDWRLWPHDLRGSGAWVRGLKGAGVLKAAEARRLAEGLERVADQLKALPGPQDLPDEDVHSLIERLLVEAVGPVGGKLHTGRSRNDQVATAFRLWAKDAIRDLRGLHVRMIESLRDRARDVGALAMPGYTHLQRAQPITAAHWLLSRAWPLMRDLEALAAVERECDVMPLGSGAVAGCPFPVDRDAVAADLGFAAVSENSVDAVADRDWAARLLFAAAMTGVHLSQLAEDLVVFSSAEFGFVRLGGGFTTGSSLMPQKRNPDAAELVRGRTGRLVGNLNALLVVLKGLPAGYNRDLQEDKEAVFDSVDTLALSLRVMAGAVETLSFSAQRTEEALTPELLATDLADHLVRKGVPFRESHHAVAALVRTAQADGKRLDALALADLRQAHPAFGDGPPPVLEASASVESRAARGGTAQAAAEAQLESLDAALASLAPRQGLTTNAPPPMRRRPNRPSGA